MLGIIHGQMAFLRPEHRRVWFSAQRHGNSSRPVITATMAMTIFAPTRQQVLVQFRGNMQIDRLKALLKAIGSTGGSAVIYNGITVEGHLCSWHLPEDVNAKYSYADALNIIEASDVDTVLDGPVTTVIVVDRFDPAVVLDPVLARTRDTAAGLKIANGEMHGTVSNTLAGLAHVDPTVTHDGVYKFGLGESRRVADDPSGENSKIHYSVAATVQHGNDVARLRVEMHGKNRVDVFKPIVERNQNLMLSGILITYSDTTPYVYHYGLWTGQYQVLSIGQTMDVASGSLGRYLDSDGEEQPIVPLSQDDVANLFGDSGDSQSSFAGNSTVDLFEVN